MTLDPTPVQSKTCDALHEALALAASRELVAIVGGGGKSTLLFALAEGPGRWVLTTTTRIFAAQIERAPAHCTFSQSADVARELADGPSGLLVIGEVQGEKALGVGPEVPAELLAQPGVDCVAVEADGSRMRPTKAPADHEPVIPAGTTLVVVVAGIDALDGPIEAVAHRPERVAALLGCAPTQSLSAANLGALLRDPRGGMKDVRAGCRVAVLLNKVESERQRGLAREVAATILAEPRVERVVLAALREPGARFEVFARQTAV